MIKVSVIIPVFNAEHYLKMCLDTCANSSLNEVEFICIDDGSTDNSLNILQTYARQDDRFIVISQPKVGPGNTRNKALQLAQGEYIAFVDADDVLDPNMLYKTYNFAVMHHADVVQFNYTEYRESTQKYKKIDLARKFRKEYHYDLVKKGKYSQQDISFGLFYNLYNQVWNRIYRRTFILDNGIRFSTTGNGEDHLFTIAVLILAPTIYYLNEYLYTYRVRPGSACHTWDTKDMEYTFENMAQLEAYLQKRGLFAKYYHEFKQYCIQTMYWVRCKLTKEQIPAYDLQVKTKLTDAEFESYLELAKPKNIFFKFFTH